MKKTIGNVIFALVCLFLLVLILGQFGLLPFQITYFLTGSMRPAYQPGDLAIISTAKDQAISVGDVVWFEMNGVPVIHRAVKIDNGQITTQGDANNTADAGTIAQVKGKLLFSVPKIGYVIDFGRTLLGRLVQ
jgi:signal peptidase